MYATPCYDAVTVSVGFVEAKADIPGADITNYGADFTKYENRHVRAVVVLEACRQFSEVSPHA
jgi:hypothetical protein